MRDLLRAVFGAHGRFAVGMLLFSAGAAAWFLFGTVACCAVIATDLGCRATERVEQMVVENVEGMDVNQ